MHNFYFREDPKENLSLIEDKVQDRLSTMSANSVNEDQEGLIIWLFNVAGMFNASCQISRSKM